MSWVGVWLMFGFEKESGSTRGSVGDLWYVVCGADTWYVVCAVDTWLCCRRYIYLFDFLMSGFVD